MTKYTTGEVAKLCGVSVRTVQYYDSRGILTPSQLTDGGRRLYSEEDIQRMKIICFLREMDLPLNTIGELLKEEDPGSVIELILGEQETVLQQEIAERQKKLELITGMKRSLPRISDFSVESIGDIAHVMNSRKLLRKIRFTVLSVGIPLELIELVTMIYGIRFGIWLPYILGITGVLLGSIWILWYYFRKVAYICPHCHRVFVPRLRDAVFASHTPTARKLICPFCGHRGFCTETGRDGTEEPLSSPQNQPY